MGSIGTGRPCQRPGTANSYPPALLDMAASFSKFSHPGDHLTTHPVSNTKIHEQNGCPSKGRHSAEDVGAHAAPHLQRAERQEQREEAKRRRKGRGRGSAAQPPARRLPQPRRHWPHLPARSCVLIDGSPFLFSSPGTSGGGLVSLSFFLEAAREKGSTSFTTSLGGVCSLRPILDCGSLSPRPSASQEQLQLRPVQGHGLGEALCCGR